MLVSGSQTLSSVVSCRTSALVDVDVSSLWRDARESFLIGVSRLGSDWGEPVNDRKKRCMRLAVDCSGVRRARWGVDVCCGESGDW